MECVDLCIQLSIRQSVARCPPERSGGWAPTISPGAQPILPLTSLQFYVATDFTSEWSRTWSQPADSRGRLEFLQWYCGTPHQSSNLLQERPQFSVTVPGEFVEQILNIKEWLKSPWALESDPNDA